MKVASTQFQVTLEQVRRLSAMGYDRKQMLVETGLGIDYLNNLITKHKIKVRPTDAEDTLKMNPVMTVGKESLLFALPKEVRAIVNGPWC